MKICTQCKKEFPATTEYFFEGLSYKAGLRSKCKACTAIQTAKIRKEKKVVINTDENIKKKCSVCQKSLPATITFFFPETMGKYGLRNKCKSCFYIESIATKAIPKNREKARIAGRKYYTENKKYYAEKWRRYYKANTEHLKKKAIDWNKNNLDKRKIIDKKRRENVGFRLSSNISRSIRQSLFTHSKNKMPWESLVDFTKQELIKHLEKQFTEGMTWNNYGKWHIDHSIPILAFNFTKPEHQDFKRCWALSNLQPMWALENISKGAKLKKPFQPMLAI